MAKTKNNYKISFYVNEFNPEIGTMGDVLKVTYRHAYTVRQVYARLEDIIRKDFGISSVDLITGTNVTKIKSDGGNTMSKTVKELKVELKALGATGLSNMKKADLEVKLAEMKKAAPVAPTQTAVTKVEDPVEAPDNTVVDYSLIRKSLIEVITNPKKNGKFSIHQSKFMLSKRMKNFDTPIFLKTGEFVIPEYQSDKAEVLFICNADGVSKVTRFNKITGKVNVVWKPDMGPYTKSSNNLVDYPKSKMTVNGVTGEIELVVPKRNTVTGNIVLEVADGPIYVKYIWDRTPDDKGEMKYKIPAVYINGELSKNGKIQMIVRDMIEQFKANIKAGNIKPVSRNVQAHKEVAITEEKKVTKEVDTPEAPAVFKSRTKNAKSVFQD